MSIPLDRLYSLIENITINTNGECAVIYHFWPNGSKNINDLTFRPTYTSFFDRTTKPIVWCHDQEPLQYEFYQENLRVCQNTFVDIQRSLGIDIPPTNLNYFKNIFKKNILVHSEKRSLNVDKYSNDNELIPVYYWSHALIARDWFRYGEHENFEKDANQKLFLIYNRAWTGTREYRLKFSDLLIENGLVDHCKTFCNPTENREHYQTHRFKNPIWRPAHILENHFPPSLAEACASADFITEDYRSTEIEIVLETLFDDQRLHLTEKSLRPIACKQPFILATTHGSLQYLREYGFQTYDSVWDETYDTIQDPYQRMQAIIHLMLEITARSPNQRCKDARRIQHIADYNHKHFFSKDFADMVAGELRTNMKKAFDQIKQDPGFEAWQDRWKCFLQFPQVQDFLDTNKNSALPTRQQYEQVLEFIGQHPKTIANANKI